MPCHRLAWLTSTLPAVLSLAYRATASSHRRCRHRRMYHGGENRGWAGSRGYCAILIRDFLPVRGYWDRQAGRTADVQETADTARSPSAFSCQSVVIDDRQAGENRG